jgi:hypothetical protein
MPDDRGVWLGTSYEAVPAIFKDERFVSEVRTGALPTRLLILKTPLGWCQDQGATSQAVAGI